MRVTRFCSWREYDQFVSGHKLTNYTNHLKGGLGGSTSIGFCFTPDEPKVAWKYLKGIVDFDICMVLEFPDGYLTKSRGRYATPGGDFFGTTYKDEYCTTEYSDKTAKLVKVLLAKDYATEEEMEGAKIVKKWRDLGLI